MTPLAAVAIERPILRIYEGFLKDTLARLSFMLSFTGFPRLGLPGRPSFAHGRTR